MIKIKFENLLVSIVVSVVIFFNTISTTMLDRTFLDAKANYLLLVILLLGLRFIFPKRISFKYLIFSSLLLLSGILVYFQTGKLNFLVYSALLVLLVDVDMKVVLKTYLIVAGILVLSVFILSLLGAVPNLQYNRRRSYSEFIWILFILQICHPTVSTFSCFFLFIKDKFIWIRSLIGLLLSFFIIKYCDARLNAFSIILATIIFIFFYFNEDKKFRVYSIFPYSVVLCSSIMMYLSYIFSWGSPFLVSINKLITGRLALGKMHLIFLVYIYLELETYYLKGQEVKQRLLLIITT